MERTREIGPNSRPGLRHDPRRIFPHGMRAGAGRREARASRFGRLVRDGRPPGDQSRLRALPNPAAIRRPESESSRSTGGFSELVRRCGAYCRWLSEHSGQIYRLPTEAEWERAARGGREGALWVWGDEAPQSRADYLRRWTGAVNGPRPVGESPGNLYGVFDLGENVHEWCSDWYDPGYYSRSPEQNPAGPDSGARKASRGGSWRHHIKVTRCAARSSIPPEFQYADYGFRVARSL